MKAVSAQVVSCCVHDKSKQNKQYLHGTVPNIFECWVDLVVHLLLLKSSMANFYIRGQPGVRARAVVGKTSSVKNFLAGNFLSLEIIRELTRAG